MLSTYQAQHIGDNFGDQAARRLSRRLFLPLATAATIAGLAGLGGAR